MGGRARAQRPRSGLLTQVRRLAVDVTPLRTSRDFRLLWCGQLVSMAGRQITVVAIPYQVYSLTGSSLAVGMLGLVQVVPLVTVSLVGGAIVDSVDRRRLLLLTQVLLAACSALLAGGALLGNPPLAFVYAVAGAAAGVSAVDQPARSATIPNLVPRPLLPAALSLNFALFQVTLIAGPALGGLVIATTGLGTAYLIDVLTFGAAIAAVAAIAPQPARHERTESRLRAIGKGLDFARHQRPILGGFAIDLGAMVFGLPRALFPVLALSTFHAGPGGLGLLYAAPGAGAVMAALSTGWIGRARRLGRMVVIAVTCWGLAIAAFGLVRSLWAGVALLAVAGASDSVSALCRTTMLQLITPDELRGRLSATYFTVVAGGPYVGDVEAGAVAHAFSPAVSVVSGGIACLVAVAFVLVAFPELTRWSADAPSGGGSAIATASPPG